MNQFVVSNNNNYYKKQSCCNLDVSTGLRLAFNDHHQQQQQQQQQPSFNHHLHHQPYGYVSLLSQDLSDLIKQQGDEIDRYLQSEEEEFKRKLAEKTQRHYHALIRAAKEYATRIIREKEAVAEKVGQRNIELEAQAKQLIAEVEVWEAKARANEAVAVALQAQLQRTVVGGCVSQEEEVAACEAEDAESSYIDPERVVVVRGPGCKVCGKRVASVVLLPCRHLCVCSECDDVVQTCPLCLSFRSSSIEVYMS